MKTAQKIVCITGMERSGTSMVARIANLMGVSLGPERKLIMETDYNEKGCWESRSLLEISDEILKRMGGSTHEPPRLARGWENGPGLADLEQKARRIIEKDFSGLPAWGWKDTRCCLTLPFWQKLLPEMEYVICVRNPVDVVNSLLERGWCSSFAGAFHIWLAYTASAVEHTRGRRRIFVFYDEFMGEGLEGEAERLARFLGPDYLERLHSAQGEIRAFVSGDLRHHGTPLLDVLNNPEIPLAAKSYYALLLLLAKEEGGRSGLECGNAAAIDAVSSGALRTPDSETEMMRLRNSLDVKTKQVEGLLGSWSWRITGPLRAAYDMIFGRLP